MFFNFLNFFLFFLEFSCQGQVWTEFGTKILFSLSRSTSSRFDKKQCWVEVLQFFEFFYQYFRNSLFRVEYERNSGLKFFSHFFIVSHPVLAKNKAGKRFYSFLNFFNIFFGIFLPGSSTNGIRDENFSLSFLVYLILFWLKIMPGRGFIIFCMNGIRDNFFFLFFFLSHQVSRKNNAGKRFYNFLNFFTIFF